MNYVTAKCLLCGKTYQLAEDNKDYKKLSEKSSQKDSVGTFICDMCNNKVRFESDEKQKAKKPM